MDLLKLIQANGLQYNFVAEKLFPENKHPYNALSRLIRKGVELSESQIKTLCELTGATPNELLGFPQWSGNIIEGTLELKKGNYCVSYQPSLRLYTVSEFDGKCKILLGTFPAPVGCTVKQFLGLLEDQINEF